MKPEKAVRDAPLRHRLKEVVELAKADPVYGISPEEAMKRAAAKVKERHDHGEKKGGKK